MKINKKALFIIAGIIGAYFLFKTAATNTATEDKEGIEQHRIVRFKVFDVEYSCEFEDGKLVCYTSDGRRIEVKPITRKIIPPETFLPPIKKTPI